jgi:hypothetical protein
LLGNIEWGFLKRPIFPPRKVNSAATAAPPGGELQPAGE